MLSFFYGLLRIVFYSVAAAALIVFVVSNRDNITLSFYPLPYTISLPAYLFGMLALAAGFLLGGLACSQKMLRLTQQQKRQNERLQALENEVTALKAPHPGSNIPSHRP